MYILRCNDGSYYTGSTNDLEIRLAQHQAGKGANHTKKRLPVELVYYERYPRVDMAFDREKQVQGWSRKKKEALINGDHDKLPELAKSYRDVASSTSHPRAEALEARAKNDNTPTVSSRTSSTSAATSDTNSPNNNSQKPQYR